MARKSNGYWEKRSTKLMLELEEETEKTINSLIQVYEQATKNINKEIVNIFKNYAKDTGLDRKTLLELLNKSIVKVKAYNKMADYVYNKLENGNIILINGEVRIDGTVEINKIWQKH